MLYLRFSPFFAACYNGTRNSQLETLFGSATNIFGAIAMKLIAQIQQAPPPQNQTIEVPHWTGNGITIAGVLALLTGFARWVQTVIDKRIEAGEDQRKADRELAAAERKYDRDNMAAMQASLMSNNRIAQDDVAESLKTLANVLDLQALANTKLYEGFADLGKGQAKQIELLGEIAESLKLTKL